ncbi:hypothetical protein IP87_16125, partial [beta proteobacterium AAP121]
LAVAALLGAVAVGVAWAQRQFGNTGLLLGTALAALADAHAPVAAAAARHGSAEVDAAVLRQVVLVAVGTNALTRTVTAFVAGGRRYGLGIGASLVLSTGAALAVALITG